MEESKERPLRVKVIEVLLWLFLFAVILGWLNIDLLFSGYDTPLKGFNLKKSKEFVLFEESYYVAASEVGRLDEFVMENPQKAEEYLDFIVSITNILEKDVNDTENKAALWYVALGTMNRHPEFMVKHYGWLVRMHNNLDVKYQKMEKEACASIITKIEDIKNRGRNQ